MDELSNGVVEDEDGDVGMRSVVLQRGATSYECSEVTCSTR